jgi:hypothetical protein
MVDKAGPYVDANYENTLKKMALQLGLATPSQVGLSLEPKKKGEMNAVEVKSQFPSMPKIPTSQPLPSNNLPGQPQQGRPKNSKDTQPRKKKNFSPQTGASVNLWAITAQDKISEILNPILLDFYHKKNMRSLSSLEYNETEEVKTKVLLSLNPLTDINTDIILEKFSNIDSLDVHKKYNEYKIWSKVISIELNKNFTIDEIKQNKAYFISMVYENP